MNKEKRTRKDEEVEELLADPLVGDEWEQVEARMPVDLEQTAKETKALQRKRAVRSGADLLRLAMAYAVCDWPLRTVGVWATVIDLGELSDVAVLKRLRACPRWLGQLVVAWLQQRRVRLRQQAVRLRLVDATVISQPGSQGTDWRVHLSLDLGTMSLDGIEVTDGHGGESLARHPAQPGDIIVADRGHARAPGLGTVLEPGAEVVVRIGWRTLVLQDASGQPLDLIAWLRQAPETEPAEEQVRLETPQGTFDLRLVAHRLAQSSADAARRRIRRAASRKGRTPDARTLFAAGFVVVVTNLPAAMWTAEQVLALYRVRWQIELACKRLKSLLHLDHLRAVDPDLVQTYLLTKLLAALITDDFSQQMARHVPEWFTAVDRPLSPWRVLMLGRDWLGGAVRGVLRLTSILAALPRLARYLRDSPRQRPQQAATARTLLQSLLRSPSPVPSPP